MKNSSDKLSRATSALFKLLSKLALRDEVESELPQVDSSASDSLAADKIVRSFGFASLEAFFEELEEKVSSKWVHFSGLPYLMRHDEALGHYGSNL